MTQAWYNKRTASAAVFFFVTAIAFQSDGCSRCSPRNWPFTPSPLQCGAEYRAALAMGGRQKWSPGLRKYPESVWSLEMVLTCLDSYPPEPNKRSGIARYRKMVDKC